MTTPTCETCRFYQPMPSDEWSGHCRRYPPVEPLDEFGLVVEQEVRRGYWCGEWQALVDTTPLAEHETTLAEIADLRRRAEEAEAEVYELREELDKADARIGRLLDQQDQARPVNDAFRALRDHCLGADPIKHGVRAIWWSELRALSERCR